MTTLTQFSAMAIGDTFRCGPYLYRKRTTKTAACLDAFAPHRWMRFEGWTAVKQVWLVPGLTTDAAVADYIEQNR